MQGHCLQDQGKSRDDRLAVLYRNELMMLNIYIRELGWKEKDEKYENDVTVGEGGGLNHHPLHLKAQPPITNHLLVKENWLRLKADRNNPVQGDNDGVVQLCPDGRLPSS